MFARGARGVAAMFGIWVLAWAAVPGGLGLARTASATQNVKLGVKLSPERLGAGTTIEFSTQISASGKLVPSPLSELDLRYPAKMGLLTSGLGRASCTATVLEILGEKGCPANALMGFGSALVEIQAGRQVVPEAGGISIWMGPVVNEQLQLLFSANAVTPASEQLVFPGLLKEAGPPFGGSLDTEFPPIPWNPEAPPASIVRFSARIGSQNVTYYRHTGTRKIAYRPEGLRLPHFCPRGGFPFAATFAFMDGTSTSTRTSVPCPQSTGRRARRAPRTAYPPNGNSSSSSTSPSSTISSALAYRNSSPHGLSSLANNAASAPSTMRWRLISSHAGSRPCPSRSCASALGIRQEPSR